MIEVELAAAVRAVEETVQWAFIPHIFFSSSAAFLHLMYDLPRFFVNDRVLRVFRDDPVGFVIENALMGLIGYGLSSVADRVPAVFVSVKNVQNRARMPQGSGCFKFHAFSFAVTPAKRKHSLMAKGQAEMLMLWALLH